MNANVGMLNPVAAAVATYTPGTSITYGTGIKVAEAVSATVNWNRADGRFYGDDAELDSENGVTGYTIDFEPTGLTDAARQYLLGEAVSSGEYTITDASSPDVGFGYVRVMRATNATSGAVETSYEGWWFYKVKFALSSEEARTKESNIEWRTPTLNGAGAGILLDATGTKSFAVHETFATKAAAVAYVNGKAGLT